MSKFNSNKFHLQTILNHKHFAFAIGIAFLFTLKKLPLCMEI